MPDRIEQIFKESIAVKQKTLEKNREAIRLAVAAIVKSFKAGNKVILFGNGGSAADSQHVAAEFVGRFQKERRALPAVALTTDTSCLTALSNDYSFDIVFSRQIEALGQAGDTAIAISTSGNSRNVMEGVTTARKLGLRTIALTGGDGGALASMAEVALIVPSEVTARVQEAHSVILHCLCELVEQECLS